MAQTTVFCWPSRALHHLKLRQAIVLGIALLASMFITIAAQAQGAVSGEGSAQVGNATISAEAGGLFLDLPRTDFTGFFNINNIAVTNGPNQRLTDHDGDGWGWRGDLAIEGPISMFGRPKIGAVKGYFGQVDDDQSHTCATTGPLANQTRCAWFGISNLASQPPLNVNYPANGDGYFAVTQREITVWGLALEGQTAGNSGNNGFRFKAGVDWRNIDQDTRIRLSRLGLAGGLFAGDIGMRYRENLDTYYLGGYVGVKGERDLRPGLALLMDAQIGIYHGHAKYDGLQTDRVGLLNTASDSEDELTGIAVASVGLRKNFRRASLSLSNSLEWYSWAPYMEYNDALRIAGVGTFLLGPNDGTTIGDGDAFSFRTSLRLSIKLGPDSLFEDPLK